MDEIYLDILNNNDFHNLYIGSINDFHFSRIEIDLFLSDWFERINFRNGGKYHVNLKYFFKIGGLTFIDIKYKTKTDLESSLSFISYNRGSSWNWLQSGDEISDCAWVLQYLFKPSCKLVFSYNQQETLDSIIESCPKNNLLLISKGVKKF